MKRTLTILAGVLGTSFALAQAPPARETKTTTTTAQFHRVSTIVGSNVMLGTETLGKVTEVVIDDRGCVEFVVVQFREGFVPVPWGAATVEFERRTIVLRDTKVTADRLRELSFTEDRWPNFADRQWTEKMRTVWGEAAFRTHTGAGQEPPAADRRDRRDNPPPERPNTKPGDRQQPPPERPNTNPPEKKPPANPDQKEPPKKEQPPKKEPPKKEPPKKEPPPPDKP